jgi:hypothetical protein
LVTVVLTPQVRAVFVDSETKVAPSIAEGVLKAYIRASNIVTDLPGCGGSFALGFYAPHIQASEATHGPGRQKKGTKPSHRTNELLCKALRVIRDEVARCVGVTNIVMMHSVAGGTGSGLR